jgi:hypothetical protein
MCFGEGEFDRSRLQNRSSQLQVDWAGGPIFLCIPISGTARKDSHGGLLKVGR